MGSLSVADLAAISKTTHRGFTSQEELDNLSLIDLNGRVYDPTVGRFLSADPEIQAPFESQSLNRYSYTFDNPLNATDPTGFDACTTGTHIDRPAGVGCEAQTAYRSNGEGGAAQQQASAGQPGATGSARSPDAGQQSGQVDPNKLAREQQSADQNGAPGAVTVFRGTRRMGQSQGRYWGASIPEYHRLWTARRCWHVVEQRRRIWQGAFNLGKGAADLANPLSGLLEDVGLGTPDLPIDDDQLGGAAGLDILSAGLGVVSLEADAARGVAALEDSALVVRGGGTANQTAARINAAIGPSRTPGVSGFSAQCNGGTCLSELGQFLRNKQLGVTTVGAIRAAGGDVIRTPGLGYHTTVTGLSGEAASPLFRIVPNPNPLVGP